MTWRTCGFILDLASVVHRDERSPPRARLARSLVARERAAAAGSARAAVALAMRLEVREDRDERARRRKKKRKRDGRDGRGARGGRGATRGGPKARSCAHNL
jgi:hypothetical protein